jgi:signal transduction histidine kinase
LSTVDSALTVLVVDDDPDHRLLLASALQEALPGCCSREAGDPSEALEYLRSLPISAVVCDYRLGSGTGLGLLRDVQQAGVDVPFFLVTNHGSEEVARMAFLAGVSDYLAKESALQNPADLGRRLRRAVEKHRLARQRQRAEEMLENFVENNPFGILLLDPEGRVSRWNRALERMGEPPRALAEFLAGYRPGDDLQLRRAGVVEALARARTGQRVELPAFPWDPREAGLPCGRRFFQGVAFPVGPQGEEAAHLCVMIQDVTAAETARRERDEYAAVLSALFDASQTAIFFVDNQRNVRFANRRVREFFGLEPEACLGRAKLELAEGMARSVADPEGFLRRVQYLYEHPEVEAEDAVEILRPQHRHLRRHSGPVRGAGPTPLGRIEVYLDETAAVERQQLLEAENRELDAFASRLAHELKTPLVSLKGFADLLHRQHGGLLDQRGNLYVERVRASAGLLGEMVDGLRNLAHAGSFPETASPVELSPVLRLVCDSLESLARDNGVTVELRSRSGAVRCGRAPLFQILHNLLANAIRFADPDKELRWVRVEVAEEGPSVRVTVADNGIGMDEEDRECLFQPFRRGRNAEGTTGMGLGLAITRRLVHACGGAIRVESTPGEGSRFTVSLPRSRPLPEE